MDYSYWIPVCGFWAVFMSAVCGIFEKHLATLTERQEGHLACENTVRSANKDCIRNFWINLVNLEDGHWNGCIYVCVVFTVISVVIVQTVHESGDLQVWRSDSGQLISTFSVGAQVCIALHYWNNSNWQKRTVIPFSFILHDIVIWLFWRAKINQLNK